MGNSRFSTLSKQLFFSSESSLSLFRIYTSFWDRQERALVGVRFPAPTPVKAKLSLMINYYVNNFEMSSVGFWGFRFEQYVNCFMAILSSSCVLLIMFLRVMAPIAPIEERKETISKNQGGSPDASCCLHIIR